MTSLAVVSAQRCSIARSLEVLGQKWTLLVLREAVLRGSSRFGEFRRALGVAPDVLADRLTTLVDAGVMVRRPYREAGERERVEYVLTEAGVALKPVLAAITEWGDVFAPSGFGPAVRLAATDGRPVRLAFVDEQGDRVADDEVVAVPGPGMVVDPDGTTG